MLPNLLRIIYKLSTCFCLPTGEAKTKKSKNVYIIICNTRDISLVYITKGLFLKYKVTHS